MDSRWPRGEIQRIIADALHASLMEATTPSIAIIAPINAIGSFLLNHITGLSTAPVAGSIEVRCGGMPFGVEAHIENLDSQMYYVWIEADLGEQGIELIDFGSRYWGEWAEEQYAMWTGTPPPPFIWGPRGDIPPEVVEYTPHDEITDFVRDEIRQTIVEQEDDSCVSLWEEVINATIDRMMENDTGLQYLVDNGIAEPVDLDDDVLG